MKLEDVEKIADFVIKNIHSEKINNTNIEQINETQEITLYRM